MVGCDAALLPTEAGRGVAADGAKWDAAADRASVERGAVPAERVKSADCGEG